MAHVHDDVNIQVDLNHDACNVLHFRTPSPVHLSTLLHAFPCVYIWKVHNVSHVRIRAHDLHLHDRHNSGVACNARNRKRCSILWMSANYLDPCDDVHKRQKLRKMVLQNTKRL